MNFCIDEIITSSYRFPMPYRSLPDDKVVYDDVIFVVFVALAELREAVLHIGELLEVEQQKIRSK